jgi:hypothetical protein
VHYSPFVDTLVRSIPNKFVVAVVVVLLFVIHFIIAVFIFILGIMIQLVLNVRSGASIGRWDREKDA